MKHFVFFTVLMFSALYVQAQDIFREVDLKVNGVGSGASYQDLVKSVGKPLQTTNGGFDRCGGGYIKVLRYDGLKVEFLGDDKKRNFKVFALEIVSPKWTIAPQINIGASVPGVTGKFGQPNGDAGKDVLDYVTRDNLGVVKFYFRNHKLIKAEMRETLC